jgi:hypothetical protein
MKSESKETANVDWGYILFSFYLNPKNTNPCKPVGMKKGKIAWWKVLANDSGNKCVIAC